MLPCDLIDYYLVCFSNEQILGPLKDLEYLIFIYHELIAVLLTVHYKNPTILNDIDQLVIIRTTLLVFETHFEVSIDLQLIEIIVRQNVVPVRYNNQLIFLSDYKGVNVVPLFNYVQLFIFDVQHEQSVLHLAIDKRIGQHKKSLISR